MLNGSSLSVMLRALPAKVGRNRMRTAAAPVCLPIELLEGRTLFSATPGGADAQRLYGWWALSGSSQLTQKLSDDAARSAAPARRAAPARTRYDAPKTAAPAGATPTDTATTDVSVSALSAAPAAAAVTLVTIPNSDTFYGTLINANEYTVPGYMAYLSPNLGMITDLVGTSTEAWNNDVATLESAHPGMLVGTYHSARDAQLAGTFTHVPRRAVPREGLTSRQILMKDPAYPDVHIVDYSQSAARKYLVKNVVDDVVKTGRPLAFLDNVSHQETGFPINWTTTTSVIREMRTNLHAQGKRVIVNAAWVPGITSTQSVDQLIATGVDGVSLETGFHQNVRNDVTRINTAISQYRKMLDAGIAVIFIPVGSATGDAGTVENLEIEQRLQAAFGMMFRKPGDRLFTNQLFWQPIPEWTDWTRRFGPALGDATITKNAEGQIVMTRRFTNYTLTANVATKQVTYQP